MVGRAYQATYPSRVSPRQACAWCPDLRYYECMSYPRLPVGLSVFRQIRQGGYVYVDKSGLIREVLDASAQVLLLPRPRRFGKTLNLSMLHSFLERSAEDLSPLFADLSVWREVSCRGHFQRYPTIFLTFKDVKATSWAHCLAGIRNTLALEFERHALGILPVLSAPERAYVEDMRYQRGDEPQWWDGLRRLSTYLARGYAEPVVILIDEYDTPIHAGFAHGYYAEVTHFFRNFLSGGLKDNPALFKGVMTGILRVARASLFSGLNNLGVYTLLRPEFRDRFGFTTAEVAGLVQLTGGAAVQKDLERWYNGYMFGGELIFNPWSVLNFLDSQDRRFRPYWVATGSDDLLRRLLLCPQPGVSQDLAVLLQGGTVRKRLQENITLPDLARRPEALWSFLLFTGYLRVEREEPAGDESVAILSIPNREVYQTYRDIFRSWLEQGLGGGQRVQALLSALLSGDAPAAAALLQALLVHSLSYHDLGAETRALGDTERSPERVYQSFLLGLLVYLEDQYEVRSNPESDHGRCDVMLAPRVAGQPGVVLELKVLRPGENPERVLSMALTQIAEQDYSAGLRHRRASPIHEMAIVFDAKRVYAQTATPRKEKQMNGKRAGRGALRSGAGPKQIELQWLEGDEKRLAQAEVVRLMVQEEGRWTWSEPNVDVQCQFLEQVSIYLNQELPGKKLRIAGGLAAPGDKGVQPDVP